MSTATHEQRHEAVDVSQRDRRLAAILALAFGIVLVFVTGFAPMEVVHNAAHDVRHSAATPCH